MAKAASSECTLSTTGNVTTVPVGVRCKVIYRFDTSATKKDLALPYVVQIDGKVDPSCVPGTLSASKRTIELSVPSGSKVALFLNSDVHPDFRTAPAYAIEVGQTDVHVNIKELKGRISHEKDPVVKPAISKMVDGKRVQMHEAALTGDIWMKISHRYTVVEAEAMLDANAPAAVRSAIVLIYSGKALSPLTLNFPANGEVAACTMRVKFDESDNIRENTTHCPTATEVLPRTHPKAFIALFTEAYAAGVTALTVTSTWRPCLGSIGHRAGLGIDVSYIEAGTHKIPMDRKPLKGKGSNVNVSQREKELFAEYEKASKESADAQSKLQASIAELKKSRDAEQKLALQAEIERARTARDAAIEKTREAKNAWIKECELNEKSAMRSFREKLGVNGAVKQILDPWYLDLNTHDKIAPVLNEQRNEVEKLHNNHLHLTIREPQIYD